MSICKDLLPDSLQLSKLGLLNGGLLFVDSNADPVWETIYIKGTSGEFFVLSWSYVDVEFKFEIYGISVETVSGLPERELSSVSAVDRRLSVRFLVRAEWLRPTFPGEVPETYEQVIEESGRQSAIPASSTAAGVALRGIAFMDPASGLAAGIIGVDDDAAYSLIWITGREAIDNYLSTCDGFDLPALLLWRERLGEAETRNS